DAWGDLSEDETTVNYPHELDRTYRVYLPAGLRAAGQYRVAIDASALRDMFGRKLPKPITVRFTTDHRNPNIVVDYQAAVLEKDVDSEVPVYVNNLKQLTWDYSRLTLSGPAKGLTLKRAIPHVPDVQFAIPAGIREMLGGQSGAVWTTY